MKWKFFEIHIVYPSMWFIPCDATIFILCEEGNTSYAVLKLGLFNLLILVYKWTNFVFLVLTWVLCSYQYSHLLDMYNYMLLMQGSSINPKGVLRFVGLHSHVTVNK